MIAFITSVYCVFFVICIVIQSGQLPGNFIISCGMRSLIWLGSRMTDRRSKNATLITLRLESIIINIDINITDKIIRKVINV